MWHRNCWQSLQIAAAPLHYRQRQASCGRRCMARPLRAAAALCAERRHQQTQGQALPLTTSWMVEWPIPLERQYSLSCGGKKEKKEVGGAGVTQQTKLAIWCCQVQGFRHGSATRSQAHAARMSAKEPSPPAALRWGLPRVTG